MSLHDQFAVDADEIFICVAEFAEMREFRISDGRGGFRMFQCKVVWDEEMARQLQVVKTHGVYQGHVVLFIPYKNLPRAPIAGELLYTPANEPWEVLDVTMEEAMYKVACYATRSQPAYYGAN